MTGYGSSLGIDDNVRVLQEGHIDPLGQLRNRNCREQTSAEVSVTRLSGACTPVAAVAG